MKKKFFSKLLMGLLLLGTVSSYVSCKDYDDDIANLQSQIDAKATLAQLEDLKSQIAAAQSSASSALAAAEASLQAQINGKANATDLTAAKNELQAAIDAVKAEAKAAGEKTAADITAAANAAQEAAKAAAAAQGAADAAQGTADAAADAAKKAQEAADAAAAAAKAADDKIAAAAAAATEQITKALEGVATKAELAALEAELKKLGEAHSDYVTAEDLQKEVEALKELIAASKPGETEGADAKVKALQAAVDQIWNNMITSVSLYITGQTDYTHGQRPIYFMHTKEVETVKFPGTVVDRKDTTTVTVDDEAFDFVKDREIMVNADTLIIRVSPVTAQLTSEMISVVNSNGVPVSKELIDSIIVKPYGDKLLTRADNKSGLWKVAFKLKDTYNKEKFFKEAHDNGVEKNGKSVLFAIAVNNSDVDQAERLVVSEYDLYLKEKALTQVKDFKVNGTSINDIHNRYHATEYEKKSTDKVVELGWQKKPSAKVNVVTKDPKDGDASDRNTTYVNDNRQDKLTLPVSVGEDITIEFDDYIRGFYVVLDTCFAIESNSSELNGWTSYEYDKVGYQNGKLHEDAYLFKGKKGTIKIDKLSNKVAGDIIGFRVWAVNYDGTLYDPDGRAFYVYVGNEAETADVTVGVTVENRNPDLAPGKNTGKTDKLEGTFADDVEWTIAWVGDDPKVFKTEYKKQSDNSYKWETSNASKTTSLINDMFVIKAGSTALSFSGASNNNPAKISNSAVLNESTKEVSVQIKHPDWMLDGADYQLLLTATTADGGVEVQKITLHINKKLPTTIPADLTIKTGQAGNINPLKVYVKPNTYDLTAKELGTWTNQSIAWNLWPSDVRDKAIYKVVKYGQDIKPFDFIDIFNGLDVDAKLLADEKTWTKHVKKENYAFELVGASGTKTSTVATYGKQYLGVTDWSQHADNDKIGGSTTGMINTVGGVVTTKTSYSVPYVHKNKFGEYNVKVWYDYDSLSVKFAKTGDALPTVYKARVSSDFDNKFKVQYICALDLNRLHLMTAAEILERYKNPGGILADNKTEAAAQKVIDSTYVVDYEQIPDEEFTLNLANNGTYTYNGTALKPGILCWARPDTTEVLSYLNVTRKTYAKWADLDDPKAYGIDYTNAAEASFANMRTNLQEFMEYAYKNKLIRITDVKLSDESYFVVNKDEYNKYDRQFYKADGTLDKEKDVIFYNKILNDCAVELKKPRSTEQPALTADQHVNMTIVFEDVFGHQRTNLVIPITVKKPKAQ